MLAANVCAADFIDAGQAPGAVPRARRPDAREARGAAELPARAGHRAAASATTRRRARSRPSPRPPKDRADAAQIHTMLLRSMQQAIYTSANAGHFGLAYERLHALHQPDPSLPRPAGAPRHQGPAGGQALPARPRAGGQHAAGTAQGAASRRRKPAKPMTQGADDCGKLAGAHCSANERRADEASRDVEAWLKCRFMREHLGEEFAGTVSAVDQLRPVRHARRAVCRRPGAHHRTRRRVLPLRRGAPGTARRAHRRALRRRHARAGAGQPGRPGRPAHRLPPGARRRGRAACRRAARRRAGAAGAADEAAGRSARPTARRKAARAQDAGRRPPPPSARQAPAQRKAPTPRTRR